LTSGSVSLADAERLDEDESVKALLGLKKCPDQSALGQWLRQAGAAGGVEALRQINRELVAWTPARAPKERYLHSGRLECFFDDTQIEVSGTSFQGTKLNYDGNLAGASIHLAKKIPLRQISSLSPSKSCARKRVSKSRY